MAERVDPVVFEVVWHRILDITEEMGIKYMRTSGSPILVGAYDASTGITLPDGQLVAMGPYITTQAHVLGLIVSSVQRSRARHPGIADGDMFICNDPYLGATHQPDVATVAPVYHDGQLCAWVGASGHWLDIGGSEPGGFNMNARSVFDEGLRLPPTKLVEAGVIREDLVELIMAQIREPLAELDLRGQLVANEAGRDRLLAVADEFGADVLTAVMRQGIDQVAERLRARLRSLPDGVWREVQYLDHDGTSTNVRKIVCTVTKRDDRLTIDFTGSDPQVEGFANCTFGGLRAATLSAVCIVLGYDLTWNDGVAACVDIKAPPRTIVTAEYPCAVSMSTISAIIVTLNLVLVALSRLMLTRPAYYEEAMASWCATSLGVSMIGRSVQGELTVAPEASHFAAGCGARSHADGVDTGGIIINTTANIPSIEATEDAYPLMYMFRQQLPDSGGPGRFRGGVSAGVAITPYGAAGPLATSFAGVGAVTPNAVGVAGGLPGAAVRYLRYPRDPAATGQPLPGSPADLGAEPTVMELNRSKLPFDIDLIEYHNWQGGGGFGDPLDREPESVLADVRAGLVSVEQAQQVYGVGFTGGTDPRALAVDQQLTGARREAARRHRLERAQPYTEQHPLPVPPTGGGQPPSAALAYWDLVEIDPGAGTISCQRCGQVLAQAREDFRQGCLMEEVPPWTAGPMRGELYTGEPGHPVVLRLFYCPSCARQLEADLVMPGQPGPSSVVLG